MTARRRMFTVWDAVLLAATAVLCGALFWAAASRGDGAQAVVEQNGTVLCRITLSPGQQKTTFHVPGEMHVVITAENGAAWFESSDCPDQICVRTGKLSKAGQSAVCLPAGVVLRIEGKTAANDAQTG
jgi:Uncharacterized protein conserved in bacteria